MHPLAVLDAYGLQSPRLLRQFESYGNGNWLVQDGAGWRYVLRSQLLNGEAARLDFQLALQSHLAAHDVPTPPLVTTRGVSDRVIHDDGVPWLLTRYIDGDEYDFGRPEQAAAAGALVARFHAATRSFPGDAPGPEH